MVPTHNFVLVGANIGNSNSNSTRVYKTKNIYNCSHKTLTEWFLDSHSKTRQALVMRAITMTSSILVLLLTLTHAQASSQRRVLVVGWDGARGDVVHHVVWNTNTAPHLKKLMQDGAYAPCTDVNDTQCARAHSGKHHDEEKQSQQGFEWMTAPGWASVVTGADSFQHGVANNSRGSLKVFANSTADYPTFFMQAKKLGLKTAGAGVAAFLTSHSQANSNSVKYGVLDYECGVDAANNPKVKAKDISSCNLDSRLALYSSDELRDQKLTQWLLQKIDQPEHDVIMGVYDQIDGTGHASGFSKNEKYMKAISIADGQLGLLLNRLQARLATTQEEWLILLTSDHGGHVTFYGGNHSDTNKEDEIVPFVLTTYGSKSLSIAGLRQPVRQMDAYNAVMSWIDKSYLFANNNSLVWK